MSDKPTRTTLTSSTLPVLGTVPFASLTLASVHVRLADSHDAHVFDASLASPMLMSSMLRSHL